GRSGGSSVGASPRGGSSPHGICATDPGDCSVLRGRLGPAETALASIVVPPRYSPPAGGELLGGSGVPQPPSLSSRTRFDARASLTHGNAPPKLVKARRTNSRPRQALRRTGSGPVARTGMP